MKLPPSASLTNFVMPGPHAGHPWTPSRRNGRNLCSWLAGTSPAMTNFGCGVLNQRPVALLELAARATRAGRVASNFAPGLRIVRIDCRVARPPHRATAAVAGEGARIGIGRL